MSTAQIQLLMQWKWKKLDLSVLCFSIIYVAIVSSMYIWIYVHPLWLGCTVALAEAAETPKLKEILEILWVGDVLGKKKNKRQRDIWNYWAYSSSVTRLGGGTEAITLKTGFFSFVRTNSAARGGDCNRSEWIQNSQADLTFRSSEYLKCGSCIDFLCTPYCISPTLTNRRLGWFMRVTICMLSLLTFSATASVSYTQQKSFHNLFSMLFLPYKRLKTAIIHTHTSTFSAFTTF